MKRARVVIVQEAVLQYREQFYGLLREKLAEQGVELVVIHSNPLPEENVSKDAIDLPRAIRVRKLGLRVGSRRLVWQRAHAHLRGSDLVIVEQANKHLLNYLLAAEQLVGCRRFALWGHGRNFQAGDLDRPAAWLKARLSRRPDWWFAYTTQSADVVAKTGFPRERITVVQNAFDTRELAKQIAELDAESAHRLWQEWDLGEAQIGLYIGGLFPEKRLDFVFAAADSIRATNENFVFVIAGGGTERPYVEHFARSRSWVRYVGPRFGEEKAALLSRADVLLMPARAGLVVLDAFTAEVPIAISASQPHPPEASYIRHEGNGLVVQDGGSARRYGEAVAELLRDESRRRVIAEGCRVARERYTVEEMADRFAAGVLSALAR